MAAEDIIDDERVPPTPVAEGTSTGVLLRRAHAALVERGMPLSVEELIPVVFGVSANGTDSPWHALLAKLLGASDIFQRSRQGTWTLTEWRSEDLALDAVEFVVLDVETTGLSPSRHRLIEVGAILLQGDHPPDVFDRLINPGKRIPDFIAQFTGITQEMVARAPKAENVLPDLLAFIGRRPVVGHNVSFDLGFLNFETQRLGLFAPTDGIDTIAMARRFLPGVRRPKLDALAARLGVRAYDRHRALGDAQTTADVFRLLLGRAKSEGCRTLADLRLMLTELGGKAPPMAGAVANPRPTGSLYLNPVWRKEFPTNPGVYLMRDETGTVIYVGKAKCLKDRLASYYNHPLGYTRKMDGLLQNVHAIETRVLGSELEALLVESRLIKELQPRYNVQLRNYEMYPFIKVDVTADFPRVFATREVRADGGRYFGPFNSRRAVDATIEVIQKLFAVRTCTRSLPPAAKPSDPCLRYHMGRCPAPCKGTASKSDYRTTIDEVVDFLARSRGDMMDALRDKMWEAAERNDFERAAALRDVISHADHVLLGQKLITGAIEANNLLLLYPSAVAAHAELFLVRHGRLVEQRRVPCDTATVETTLDELIRRAIWLGPPPTRVGKAEVDQINIIARWVHHHSKDHGRAFFTLPQDLDDSEAITAFGAAVVARTLAIAVGEESVPADAEAPLPMATAESYDA
ncbi:MAG: GIY-YIG nuclease family protein [Ktedonobacterales bacterium]|nr:GIY-YIG nuclease family protein [Ktedonobacterales bacterium]